MLIEEFESLLLRYVDADEEASVEFLETECKTYEQNHNIIRRDISRLRFKREFVDGYYDEKQLYREDTITVKVEFYIAYLQIIQTMKTLKNYQGFAILSPLWAIIKANDVTQSCMYPHYVCFLFY